MPVDVLVYTTADKEGSPPCMTVTDDTTIKIDAPTEKERVYQKVSSDVDILANHMAQGITAAIENGAPAGALVYAPSSLFSAQGVLAGSLVEAACGIAVSHGATELRVALLARDQAIDLFHPESDALKLKVNEANGEVQFEGSQAKKPADGAQARAIIEEALKNAEDWCQKKNVERAHCFVVVTCGVVTLMLCAGADRFDCADLSPEGKADLEKKNAYMRQLCQLCSTVGRGDDPRAISWKDSKVTKVLQGPLPAAMESRGYFAFLFLVCNGKRVAIETIDSLNVAECTVRTEGLQTISVYKTLLGHYEEMLDVVQKEKKEYVNEMVQHETHCKQRKDKYDSMVAELNGKVQAVDARIAEAKRKMESDKVNVKKECEKKITEAREKARKEVDDFKKMIQNSTQVADSQIKEKVSKIEQETVTYNRESSSQITKLETEYTTLKAEVERSEERLKEMEAVERKTHAILRPMEKTLLGLRQELAASGKPREEGKSDAELATLRPIWEVRDKVDDMSEKVRLLKIKCLQLDNARCDGIGKPKAYSSSDGSSGSDSDSSDDSSDESSSEDEEELEERRKKKEKESFDREVKQFLTVSRKEHHLVNLLEQILQYLEYGTTLHMLDNIAFRRQFFFISKDRATLHICDMDQNDVPIRKYPNASYPLNQIKELIMGQDTPSFIKAMELSPNHQLPLNRGDTPPEISSLNLVTAPFFFYRSFSIVFQSDVVVDVTAESATDYEAWIVAMHKLTTLDPQWRRGLPVETMDQYTGLLTQEREACRQCHLPPVMYLKFKELILCHPRLYMTLYDVRTLTNIDLLHCQRLFVFFVKQKWIDRYVFYFIHPTNKPEKIAPAGRGVGKKPPGKPGGLPFSPKAVMRKP